MRYFIVILCVWFFAHNAKCAELSVADKALFEVKIASSNDEIKKGLMFVKKLPENEGMLFDLRKRKNSIVGMWMKNTFIELDMLFIACDLKVVHIHKRAKPHSLDIIKSSKPFCYVVEINGGMSDKHNFCVGDKVSIKFSDNEWVEKMKN